MQATARMASVVSSALPARRRLIRVVLPTEAHPMPEPAIIGHEAKFYGYIVGLHLEPNPDVLGDPPRRLFATFEYGGSQTTWEVPDHKLFRALAQYLSDDAQVRNEHGEYGYAKLWIEWKEGQWDVDLP